MDKKLVYSFSFVLVLCLVNNVFADLPYYYTVLDNFESYRTTGSPPYEPNELRYAWDPNGATETWYFLSFAPVHTGDKALKIAYYNNDPPYYCGVSRTYSPLDWTYGDIFASLSFWFRGSPNIDQMYVRLRDGSDREAVAKYGDMHNVNDLQLQVWQLWNIDLGYFTDDNGDFDMSVVKTIEIGVGEPIGATQGVPGSGYVYFDDIRLYRYDCSFRSGEVRANLDKHCVIDWDDIQAMSDEWLENKNDYDLETDISRDGVVNFNDHKIVADNWRASGDKVHECDDWQVLHPEWIFCDDFESGTPFDRPGRYFEYSNDGGDFAPIAGLGVDGSIGMRTIFQAGEQSAGSLHLGFGRVPSSYFDQGIRNTEDFREIYYRMYHKIQAGWTGGCPAKLSRATVFAKSDWSQAMIAHLWGGHEDEENIAYHRLSVNPASCVDSNSLVECVGYNDFLHLHWFGVAVGVTPIFDSLHDDTWYCIEAHVKLNDPGQSNGVQEFWIDGQLEARIPGLDFVESYTDYALNAVFLENYWNSLSPITQERYFDNFVVSTKPIGCIGD